MSRKAKMPVGLLAAATLLTLLAAAKAPPTKPTAKPAANKPADKSAATPQAKPVDGWSSRTGYRGPQTAVQRAIVTNANNAAGGRTSGPSYVVSPVGIVWYTDTYNGDGKRMRKAITDYHNWSTSKPRTPLPAAVRAAMIAEFSASLYGPLQKNALVEHIISTYDLTARAGLVAVPADDQATLAFLRIRKQCLEWAVTVSLASGGKAKNYGALNGSAMVKDPTAYRPGMGLYRVNQSHAMIIVDILWKNGAPIQFRVAESNYGQGNNANPWNNPVGMVPWQRTVMNNRPEGLPGNRVINFEVP